MKNRVLAALAACMLLAALSGCSTAPSATPLGHVNIRLTDAPGDFEQVNLVVTGVAIHRSGDAWETLKGDTTTYDLLQLRNGASVVLADGDVPAGHYTQIRLLLGEGSHVVVGGVAYPLEIPSGFQTGYKLVGEFDLPAGGAVGLTLDFDAARSIVRTGNGSYKLKPTVRLIVTDLAGRIIGRLLPEGAHASVYAIQGADTLQSTESGTDGGFTLGALAAGLYSVAIHPAVDYRDTTLTGVEVKVGATTDAGDVTLRP